ncbi:fimbria/pilus periplasmic chaperone [Rhodanobacter sp. T12-5]|uniref:fimbrial biogenesis chaperone n=1 Tax=Rhodanobacter sp. T12-5 TaxID=2024611 RepID=UPI0011F01233|nr:fimbria/pilus periplasmic chaperone [Rhodanobacter sp. T12-5]KAA0070135.1 molecular chaperone [Rhodanobacter sp. T12-5]
MCNQRSTRRALCGLVFFLAAATVATASAGSFQVSPVNPTLSSLRPVSALTVRNTGADPTVIQLEAMVWSQPNGIDTFAPAPDILATPPIFTLPAGGTQVIRVGSRRPPDAHAERSYRLFLREIPPPPRPGFKGLRLALRISLPLFIQPNAAAVPRLEWQAAVSEKGHIRIRATNRGLAHARLSAFKLTTGINAEPLHMSGGTVYVLPGASHDWVVDTNVASGTHLRLTAEAETGVIQTDLVVAGR